ncbi:unnamed protein product [Musa acuminata subsp. burmannicoides]
MAAGVLRGCLKDALVNKVELRCGVGPRRYSTASEDSSKKVSSAFLELIDVTWCYGH